jgi:hypothetical protein
LGRLISINFTASLNSSLVGKAENGAGSAVPNAYMSVGTDMYVVMINGQHLLLNTLLRVPKTGGTYVSAFDGAEDYAGPDSFSGTDAADSWGKVYYNNPAHTTSYIGKGTFKLKTFTHAVSRVEGGSTWNSGLRTTAWSYAKDHLYL